MSHGTAPKPFNHDESRGKWSDPKDFLFACVGHAFKADIILFMPPLLFSQFGFFAIIPYLLILVICIAPIIYIQSFLGQFSGTGFISVFRIAPLFKGVGYVSLALNLITLTYYSIFSAIPLMGLFYSLRTTIPWRCERANEWIKEGNERTSPCDHPNETNYDVLQFRFQLPPVNFFTINMDLSKYTHEPRLSWMMLLCTFFVWTIVAFIAVKPIHTIGKLVRYSCCTVIAIMCIMLLRFLPFPGVVDNIMLTIRPSNLSAFDAWYMLPFIVLSTLGPGWGSFITMASFNDFKTNIYNFSWIVSFLQLGIGLAMTFLPIFMHSYLFTTFWGIGRKNIYNNLYDKFLIIPTGLTLMEVPGPGSLLFFVILFLGSLTTMVVQLISVLTTLFDEYEALRAHKRSVTLATVAVLAACSAFFCSNHGLGFLTLLTKITVVSQIFLNLMLIFVVLWVYGYERFLRDVIFMTTQVYTEVIVNIVRFVTPVFLIVGILAGLHFTSNRLFRYITLSIALRMAALTVIPWCLIPCYCIYKVIQASGRLRRCVKPTDWYPADPMNKQRYEETLKYAEVSHQLTNRREEEANDFLNATAPA